MCAGGQDIPVTLRVAGGVEGGQWKSEEDVRATPQPEEEVQTTETTETTEVPEPVGPSTPLYQPVIDRINKLSEKLPDEVAGETMEAILPRFDHTDNQFQEGIASNNNNLNRIMRHFRIRPQRPRVMDVVNPGGPGKWGGGGKQPLGGTDPRRPPQTLGSQLGATQGLAGLFGGPQREQVMPQQGIPVPQMGTQMPMPMQPAVMEEQQMEILGQPKQFANGGIVNALMATPIGQAALRQYATGGEVGEDVEAEQVLEHTPTGATIEDILAGRATFFGPAKYRHAEVIADISDTLGVPIKKKRLPIIEEQDGEGGTPPVHVDDDPAFDPNDPGGVPGGFKGQGGEFGGGGGTNIGGGTRDPNAPATLGDRINSMLTTASKFSPMFQITKTIGDWIEPPSQRRGAFDLSKAGYPHIPQTPPLAVTQTPLDPSLKGTGYDPNAVQPPGSPDPLEPPMTTTPGKAAQNAASYTTQMHDPDIDSNRPSPEEAAKQSAQTLASPTKSSAPNIQLKSITKDINKPAGIHPSQLTVTGGPRTKLGRASDAKKSGSIKEDPSQKAPPPGFFGEPVFTTADQALGLDPGGLATLLAQSQKADIYNPQNNPQFMGPIPGIDIDNPPSMVAPALDAAVKANAFGHTPDGFWSQTGADEVMGSGLSAHQLADIESQVDSFSETVGTGDFGDDEEAWGGDL